MNDFATVDRFLSERVEVAKRDVNHLVSHRQKSINMAHVLATKGLVDLVALSKSSSSIQF